LEDNSRFRPEVVIYFAAADEALLPAVLAGLEEQSVPWRSAPEQGPAGDLAGRAARESLLNVGLGISGGGVVLHLAQLGQDIPLFSGRPDSPEKARAFGENAGRLVKGLPLVPIEEPPAGNGPGDLARLIAQSIARVLADYQVFGR